MQKFSAWFLEDQFKPPLTGVYQVSASSAGLALRKPVYPISGVVAGHKNGKLRIIHASSKPYQEGDTCYSFYKDGVWHVWAYTIDDAIASRKRPTKNSTFYWRGLQSENNLIVEEYNKLGYSGVKYDPELGPHFKELSK